MSTLRSLLALAAASALSLAACERKPEPQPAPAPQPNQPTPTSPTSPTNAKPPTDHDSGHADAKPGDNHADDHMHADDHHHGPTTELGEQTVTDQAGGNWTVRANREGDVTPGGDIPIDVWITPAQGNAAKITAVRFWVGIKSGRGSMKAKADLEKDNWHTHADIPNPLPEGSRLWIEFETDAAQTIQVEFDLKS